MADKLVTRKKSKLFTINHNGENKSLQMYFVLRPVQEILVHVHERPFCGEHFFWFKNNMKQSV